jgi:alginate O-acetyltransferase complex protein AlgI
MGLTQIAASILTALLVGALTRGARRTYLLLVLSILAIYWFQPLVPLRSFDFWLPSLSLAFVILTWLITSESEAWRLRHNLIGLFIIAGFVTLIVLSRYILPQPLFTATYPPQFTQYLVFLAALGFSIALLTLLSRRFAWTLTFVIVLLIAILLILKSPSLSLQISIFFRTLANRPTETASALDLRWLGFSYIAFRLIHVLRDKQQRRLPELSLPEFATYVVFFPSLSAGPIDRAERFAGDLRNDFALTQDATCSSQVNASWSDSSRSL